MGCENLEIGYVFQPLSWEHWPQAREMLMRANRMGYEPWPEIEAGLAANDMQLVAIQQEGGDPCLAVGVVRTAMTPRGEMLDIVLAGGHDHQIWAHWALERLREGARSVGMSGVRIFGRPGWMRVFKKQATRQFVTLEMAA